ncbi:MAG: hypothetical protein ACI97A_004037, partial [Planctomycetota bacterium]
MACRSFTTQSRISKASFSALLLVAIFLFGCGGKDEAVKTLRESSQEEMAEAIVNLNLRTGRYEKWRKELSEEVLLANTAAGKILQQRASLVNTSRFQIAKLSQYHKKSKANGLSANKQFEAQKDTMSALEATISALEKEQKTTNAWYLRDGLRFREVWEDMISANRSSKVFLKAGIKDVDGLASLRDHSARLRDARRYWTDELANAMIGAKIEDQMVEMSRGTRES